MVKDPIKIINIIHFPAAYHILENEEPEVKWELKNGSWCGIWKGNWSHILGDVLLQHGYDIEYEVWRPDLRADRVYSHTFENGLVYKLFPATYYHYQWGLKRQKIAFSKNMLDLIDTYIKGKHQIVLHINAGFRYHDKLILDKFYKKVPIIAQFYTNPFIDFEREKTRNLFKYVHRQLIWNIIDEYYHKLKFIIPSTQNGLEPYRDKYNFKIMYRNNLANYGMDFQFWDYPILKNDARISLNIDPDIFVFFSSSRLIEVKQIDLMINQFAKLRNEKFRLYISGYGEKEYENYLKELVKKNEMESQIEFIGYVSEETLKKYYSACDVFVNSSKSEAGPFSTVLAANYEKPIITTNTGIVYDFLKEHESGLIINKDDSSNWFEAFAKVIKGHKINICPKKKLEDFFDWRNITEYYIECYDEVLKSKL